MSRFINRRDFVSRLTGVAAAGAATTAGLARLSADTAGQGIEQLSEKLSAVQDRLDGMDESHRRLFRALVAVAAVSTGLDALTLLKGDLLA